MNKVEVAVVVEVVVVEEEGEENITRINTAEAVDAEEQAAGEAIRAMRITLVEDLVAQGTMEERMIR